MSIVIHISGGTVQAVYAGETCHVLVIDEDNLKADGHAQEAIAGAVDRLTAKLEAQEIH